MDIYIYDSNENEIKSFEKYFRYVIYEENGKVYVELPYEGVYVVDAKVMDVLQGAVV